MGHYGGKPSPATQVVPVHGHVDHAELGPYALNLLDMIEDSLGDLHPSGGNPGNDKPGEVGISLNDLVSDSSDGLADRFRIHHEQGLRLF